MNKVIIGIVAKHKKTECIRTDSLIRDEMKQVIFDNGAIAIGILSPNEEILYTNDNWKNDENKLNKENIIDQINLCDGIILQGGSESEVFEPFVAKYCYENDIPCLGICAGQNNIVRGVGGSIFKISNPEKHSKPNEDYVHSIKITDLNSKFYKIVNKEEINVNSRHRYAIDKHPLLDVIAICDDDYKEVVESKNKEFYMGVRFHPESLYKIDENMNNIFKEFIKACSIKKNKVSDKNE